jgi:hypothetical protein
MRPVFALALALLATLLSLPETVHAETREARIQVVEIDVHSGPSSSFYATSKLHRGDTVTIVDEKDGWLLIKPPAPGQDSFSWIEGRAGQQQGRTFVVTAPQTRLRVGSKLVNQPPSVEGATVIQGTQLSVLGPARTSPDGTWIPVMPGPAEVRYIPAGAIEGNAVAAQTAPPPVAPKQPAPYSQPSFIPAATATNSLSAQAEQAEKEGRYNDALALYDQLARQAVATDYDLALKYQNRMENIRLRQRASATATGWQTTNTNADARMSVSPAANHGYAVANAAANPAGSIGDPRYTVRLVPPPPNPSPAAAMGGQWYEGGWLVRTALFTEEDHRPIYRYVPLSGHTWAYVTAGPNVGLEPFVNHIVTLYGTMQYHRIMRYWYLDAQQVAMQQQ